MDVPYNLQTSLALLVADICTTNSLTLIPAGRFVDRDANFNSN
jgi:hypothetical protein